MPGLSPSFEHARRARLKRLGWARRQAAAFTAGRLAHGERRRRSDNPFDRGSLRASWFDGWDGAAAARHPVPAAGATAAHYSQPKED